MKPHHIFKEIFVEIEVTKIEHPKYWDKVVYCTISLLSYMPDLLDFILSVDTSEWCHWNEH